MWFSKYKMPPRAQLYANADFLYFQTVSGIDISITDDLLVNDLYDFIHTPSIKKFNNSIILDNKLYLLPCSKTNDFLPLIIYDFGINDNTKPTLNVDIINILDEVTIGLEEPTDLFCVFLYDGSILKFV